MNWAEDLLSLAVSRPNEALKRARAILASDPSPLAASAARQAIGLVLREYGDIDAAVHELRIARQLARRAGSSALEADVLGTLGVALIFAGRSISGRNALDAAVRQSTGHLNRRMLFRRGAALVILGRHREALEGSERGHRCHASGQRSGLGSTGAAGTGSQLPIVGFGATRRRRPAPSRGSVRRERPGTGSGRGHVNLGLVALRLGDLPEALSCFDNAAERFQRLGPIRT